MRILYVSEGYTGHDHRFLQAIVDGGHEAFFFQLRQNEFRKEERALPSPVETVDWSQNSHPVFGLKRAVKTFRPSLIHAGPLFNATFYAGLAGCRPLVGMSWGYDLLLDAERSISKRWRTKYALGRCTTVIADSQVVKNKVISYGVEPERIETFPWGVDLDHFRPGRSAVRESLGLGDKFLLLCNRGWEPLYGVDLVIKAFIEVAKTRTNLRLVLLGTGSQAQYIQQLVEQSGVQEQVYFAGHVGHDSMPDYYRAADLYISASHCDGSSISLLEAMACGRPVLVSDILGNREWVQDGRDGWCFNDDDLQDLIIGLENAIENSERLRPMGHAARKQVEKHADWSRGTQKLMRLYQKASA